MAKSIKSDLQVGAFVLFGLVLAGVVIFLIGDERRVFDESVEYTAIFDDVEGLKSGAPVRMGGVRVGQVEKVGYSEDANDGMVHVQLSVVADASGRLRDDSVVSIENKGLLGDKMVVVTRGTEGAALPPGSQLDTRKNPGMFERIDDIAGEAEHTLKDVSKLAAALGDEKLHDDLRGTAHSVNVMMKEITEGDGYPHRLLTSREEADRISGLVENVDKTSRELNATLREMRLAVRQVRKGPGFAHDMLYGNGAKKEIGQIGDAAGEVALTLKGVREGDGFAHDLLFGGGAGTGDAVKNITQVTADLRDIVRNVKKGKGTIGALLVDPSVYDDLKRVLGDVERNDVLRALVRYSIKRDDAKKPAVEVSPTEE